MKLFLFSCLLALSQGLFYEKKNTLTDLRSYLLKGYDRSTRPVKDHNNNTTVTFGIALNNIDLDDHGQRMTAVTYLFIAWNDEFLHWFPSDYGSIFAVHFDKEDIWMPDIALFNSAKSTNVAPTSTLPVLCNYDGNLLWVPPFTAEVPCEIDIEMWPSDVHTCVIRFGSWAHHGEQIDLQVDEDKAISVEFLQENKRWSIVNYTATREFTEYKDELYLHVDFKITVKREAAAYAAYVTQTMFGIMIMILGSYFLPLSYHLSRFLIHLFSITILVSCQLVLFISLPATGGSIPHVVKYFSGSIVLTTLSLLCNILLVCSITASKGIHINLRRTISSLLKSNRNPPIEIESREEVEYNHLRDTDSAGTPVDSEEGTSTRINQERMKNAMQLHRVLNVVLFALFFTAYVIDYALMRQTIGY